MNQEKPASIEITHLFPQNYIYFRKLPKNDGHFSPRLTTPKKSMISERSSRGTRYRVALVYMKSRVQYSTELPYQPESD